MKRLSPAVLRRCDAGAFAERDFDALALAAERPLVGRLLRHVTRITPSLVRQLDLVPAPLCHPSVFAVLADLEISSPRWGRTDWDLRLLDHARRATLARRARSIGDRGALWDLLEDIREAAFCERSPTTVPDLGADFVPLRDAAAMHREARLMRNCLVDLIPDAAAGRSAFFRWTGSEPVTVQLRRASTSTGWAVAHLGTRANAALAGATRQSIEGLLREALGENAFERPALDPGMLEVAEIGRARLDEATRGAIARVLWRVHDRASRTENACIFGAGSRYVQFCVGEARRSLRCEISAHRFSPENARWMTEAAVGLLERCGFRWPKAGQNFAREVVVRTAADFDRLAEFVCGAHHVLWGHQAGCPIEFKVIG